MRAQRIQTTTLWLPFSPNRLRNSPPPAQMLRKFTDKARQRIKVCWQDSLVHSSIIYYHYHHRFHLQAQATGAQNDSLEQRFNLQIPAEFAEHLHELTQ